MSIIPTTKLRIKVTNFLLEKVYPIVQIKYFETPEEEGFNLEQWFLDTFDRTLNDVLEELGDHTCRTILKIYCKEPKNPILDRKKIMDIVNKAKKVYDLNTAMIEQLNDIM